MSDNVDPGVRQRDMDASRRMAGKLGYYRSSLSDLLSGSRGPVQLKPESEPHPNPIGDMVGKFLYEQAPDLLRQIGHAPEAIATVKAAVSNDPIGFMHKLEEYRQSLAEDPQTADTGEEE